MQLVYDQHFVYAFVEIWNYIAKDSKNRADNFEKNLKAKLTTLTHMPYRHRQSAHFNSENIRDYIFKGYTIPYLVDEERGVIVILDIFKWTDKERK